MQAEPTMDQDAQSSHDAQSTLRDEPETVDAPELSTTRRIGYIVIGAGLVFAVVSSAAIIRAGFGIYCGESQLDGYPSAKTSDYIPTEIAHQSCDCPCRCNHDDSNCFNDPKSLEVGDCCYFCKEVTNRNRTSTSSSTSPPMRGYPKMAFEKFWIFFMYGWYILANLWLITILLFTAVYFNKNSDKLGVCKAWLKVWFMLRLAHLVMLLIAMLVVFPLSFWRSEGPQVVHQSLWKCCMLELQVFTFLVVMITIVWWLMYLIQKALDNPNFTEGSRKIAEA